MEQVLGLGAQLEVVAPWASENGRLERDEVRLALVLIRVAVDALHGVQLLARERGDAYDVAVHASVFERRPQVGANLLRSRLVWFAP